MLAREGWGGILLIMSFKLIFLINNSKIFHILELIMIWKLFFGKNKDLTEKVDWLVACLGNPGSKYAGTRHNIGWMCAAEICKNYHLQIESLSNIYLQAHYKIDEQNIMLVMPTTYMNKSGEALKRISERYKIPTEKIILVFDELNFPLGKLHLRYGGGNGGHNGVASVIEELGNSDFYRLRCGIGNDFPPGGMIDYVLSPFNVDEQDTVKKMIEKTPDCIELLLRYGKMRAMTDINSGNI